MASLFSSSALVTLAILSCLLVQGTLGGLTCEQLSKEDCAFAVSCNGKRCVLEKYVKRSGEEAYKCTTSGIQADKLKDLVETNHCIEACGLDRDTLGISSDSLLESRFTQKLCSPQCYQRCPNIIDLYFNLAAGEGVFLPKLCETQGGNPRRGMSEIKSSGIVAPGPGVHAANLLGSPIESPVEHLELGIGAPPAESPMSMYAPPAESPMIMDAPPAESPMIMYAPPAESPMNMYAPPVEPPMAMVAPLVKPPRAMDAPPAESPMNMYAPPVESPGIMYAPGPSPYY